MKRRNVENGKLRRPMKSKKTSDSNYSGLYSYVKFLAVWLLVLLADFTLEFRFEYLYPVWLLIRSVQDSYKYQGVFLTMLFLAAALGADMLCYIFIPVQWLFFAASSYVWVQYVWHTDRGLCLSSVSLWLLFIYVEIALRLKDSKTPRAFNIDLTRPFAAHCIGYPVVTLGYGIKTAASESLRRRTRRKVKKSNIFYQQLLQAALPIELQESALTDDLNEDVTASSEQPHSKTDDISDSCSDTSDVTNNIHTESNGAARSPERNGATRSTAAILSEKLASLSSSFTGSAKPATSKSPYIEEFDVTAESEARELHRRTDNDLNDETENALNNSKSKVPNKDPLPASRKLNSKKNRGSSVGSSSTVSAASSTSTANTSPLPVRNELKSTVNTDSTRPDFISRLETDIKKLKADLQASRNTESELRSQLSSKSQDDRQNKLTLSQLQQDNDNLQNKLHSVVMSRQQDKQSLTALEKKLQEEKKLREKSESQLVSERKAKKQEDQVAARAVALATANRANECSDNCKTKTAELEEGVSKLKWEMTRKDEQIRQLMAEAGDLRRNCQENHSQMNQELVKTAVNSYQIRIAELQASLSTETKMKIELYQALGDCKRQFEMQTKIMAAKDMEIAGLRSHIAEALALVPSSMYTDTSMVAGQYTTPKLGSPTTVPVSSSSAAVAGPLGQMYTSAPGSPPPHVIQQMPVPNSPRFSPTSQQTFSECGSPAKTPTNELSSTNPKATLNPQAKDYLPGPSTPTSQ